MIYDTDILMVYLLEYFSSFLCFCSLFILFLILLYSNGYYFILFYTCFLVYFWNIYPMIEINLLFFCLSFLMFNSSSEMSVYITFSRIPKCLHLLPFCVAVDALIRHPVPEIEPTKFLLRSFILNPTCAYVFLVPFQCIRGLSHPTLFSSP